MQYISLKIAGNPAANSGFGPLVSFNSPDFVLEDKYPVGFDAAPYVVSVKIEGNQVVYRIFINNVHSYGASRLGRLFIGISTPRGWRLTGGRSPYDVLMAITDEFKRRCMRPIGSSWEYQNVSFPVDFTDFCQQFTIEKEPMPWHAMADNAPVGHLIRPESEIALLLKDVQYPQFENFSEIYIAPVGTPQTDEVTGIEIPRRPAYVVSVNGATIKTVSSLSERVVVNPLNPEHYETEAFTIAEVLANPAAYPQVSVDVASEKVEVRPRPRQKRFTVDFVPALEGLRKHPDQVHIYINNVQVPMDSNFSFTRTGAMITFNPDAVRAEYTGADYEVYPEVSVNGDRITLSGRKLEKKPPVVVNPPHKKDGNKPATAVPGGGAESAIRIVLPEKFEFSSDNHEHAIDVRLMRGAGGGEYEVIQQTYVRFHPEDVQSGKNKSRREVGYMPVLAEWMKWGAFLEFTEGGHTYATAQTSVAALQATVQSWSPSKLSPKTLGNDKQFLWAIVAFIAGVLLTLGCIWGWNHFFGGEKAAEEQQDLDSQEVVVDRTGEGGGGVPVVTPDPNQLTTEQAADFFNRANAALAKPELTFAQIESLYNEFTNMQPKMSQEIATGNSENIARLNLYNKIAKAFEVADDASIEMLANYAAEDLNKVPDVALLARPHFSALHYLLWSRLKADGNEDKLTPDQRKQAAQYLKKHAHEYEAFIKLPAYVKLFPATQTPPKQPKTTEKKTEKTQEKKEDKANKQR